MLMVINWFLFRVLYHNQIEGLKSITLSPRHTSHPSSCYFFFSIYLRICILFGYTFFLTTPVITLYQSTSCLYFAHCCGGGEQWWSGRNLVVCQSQSYFSACVFTPFKRFVFIHHDPCIKPHKKT